MVTPPPLQLVKKVVQSGDTACLQPTLDVFRHEDRQLLQGHCHARALAILQAQPGGAEGRAHTREAIAYLSLAIFAAGRSRPRTPRGPHPVPGARGQEEPLPCGDGVWSGTRESEHVLGSGVWRSPRPFTAASALTPRRGPNQLGPELGPSPESWAAIAHTQGPEGGRARFS